VKQFDYLSITILENISNFIMFSPYSQDVKVTYPIHTNLNTNGKKETISTFGYENMPMFGYEEIKPSEPLTTEAVILYHPERRFLRAVGIGFDSEGGQDGELPIIAFFKEQDNIIKDCKIELDIYSTEDKQIKNIKRTLMVSDIHTVGNFSTGKVIHILTPFRG
jgi:hypothetical protein